MTNWLPSLPSEAEPKYQALLAALQGDVDAGILPEGTRLPPQRELATKLGIAIGTVSRAYALAERRGIVSGEVGRGTFVRRRALRESADDIVDPQVIDLSRGRLVRDPDDAYLAQTLERLAHHSDINNMIELYQPPAGTARHRAAGAAWIRSAGLQVGSERVVITSGAQHGAAVVLAATTRPGDVVLCEEVTYPGIAALANLLHLTLRGLPMDADGLRPDGLEAACNSDSPRALFCMSTLQNPTGRTMPESRRREIGALASAHDLAILEDDVNGFLPAHPTPPIASFAPDHTFYITGTSKSLAPGLRIGYLVPPAHQVQQITSVIETTTWFTAPLLAEVVTDWIETGEAQSIAAWKREETAARHAMAVEVLGKWLPAGPVSFHLWIPLPEPWRAESFVSQARSRGVIVNSAEEFRIGRSGGPHAVRVCLGATVGRDRLREGLRRLAELLESPQRAAMVY
ncbi:MAG TPA: PLP-dependent aminotransferase family protein [Gemmatimonadales bacterium]|nr:PLP-dependent aminotransferase family protein [Gemmatimonadales bacterium]